MIAFALGFVAGVIAAAVYNYFKPSKFDRLTQKAADEVKERL